MFAGIALGKASTLVGLFCFLYVDSIESFLQHQLGAALIRLILDVLRASSAIFG